ncbi:hypothetical protein RN616_20015 (plasmid) [Morganella morganii]|uniref:hypothetical protein n=1 Tax=Morganella morganii TaxID=582 RepID=UPI0028D0895E|nr:hypothetical protein [Morganella morganii]WNP32599.1 hypothetical protein RN616_20015 [Morganella morganii]
MKLLCHKNILPLLPVLLLSQGCAQNTAFSPPVNGERIRFTATVPAELEALPLHTIYRSDICRDERQNANWETYTVPGYHRERYPLTMLTPGKAEADIPESGGGECNWKLSNIVFEVNLRDPAKTDPLISKNHGEEATFVFDNHAPGTFDGGYEKKSGDVNEELILFPLIAEDFIGGHEKSFWLIGKYETLTYKVKNAKNINLTIDYKSDMKTYNIGPKKKEKNAMATFIYPDGEQEKTRELFPEYKKLMKIYDDRKK